MEEQIYSSGEDSRYDDEDTNTDFENENADFEDENEDIEDENEDIEDGYQSGSSSDEEHDQNRVNQEENRGNQVENRENQEEARGNQDEEIGNAVTSTKKKVRGLTRLVKMRKDFNESKGKKHVVEFDKWGRLIGKYRAEFSSFLGDLARRDVGLRFLKWKSVTKDVKDNLWDSIKVYYDIDESRRKQVMCHLGDHLRDFRRKLYVKYIQPNIGKPRKLKVVPEQYDFVKPEDWKKFVEWRLSPDFKDVSKAAKKARANAKYPHRLGRLGYSGLREKLVKNKEIAEDEDDIPVRSFMWRKARLTKDGEYKDDDVKNVADEMVCYEKELAEGSITLDQGTDTLTLVLGKEHSGRLRGVGRGVTPTKYWNIPRRKGSSNERIVQLEKQLDAERQLRESKDEEVKHLSAKIQKQEQTLASKDEEVKHLSATLQEQGLKLDAICSHLTSQGMASFQFPTTNNNSERKESLGSGLPSSLPMPPRQSTQLTCTSSKQSSRSKQEPSNATPSSSQINLMQEYTNIASEVVPTKDPVVVKGRLANPHLRNVVARGKIYYSSGKQTIHGVTLEDDCCRVSIDELIKPAAFLPIQAGEHKTVTDAFGSFVAWPKRLVIPDEEVPEPTSNQHVEKQNLKKRKKTYTTINELQKPKHTRSSFNKQKSNILDN